MHVKTSCQCFYVHSTRATHALSLMLCSVPSSAGGSVVLEGGAPGSNRSHVHCISVTTLVTLLPCLYQVLVAALLRPPPDSPLRPLWNYAHHNWGRLAVLIGLINTFLGIVLYTHTWAIPGEQKDVLLVWVLPCVAVLAVLLLLEVALQLHKAMGDLRCSSDVSNNNKKPPAGDSSVASSEAATAVSIAMEPAQRARPCMSSHAPLEGCTVAGVWSPGGAPRCTCTSACTPERE
jgi:hypothetical protein